VRDYADIWDRKRCFVFGLLIYGVGGLLVVIPRGSISPVWVFVAIGALIGLVLGVLIPRGSTEAGPPAPSSTAAAGEATR
jgi:MFS family permease